MATQRVSLDPALWNRTRRLAFDTGTTASRLVETALAEFLDRQEKPPAKVAGEGPPDDAWATLLAPHAKQHVPLPAHDSQRPSITYTGKPIARMTGVEEVEGGLVFHAELLETSVVADPPHPDWKVQAPGGGSVVPDAVVPEIEQRIRGGLPPAAVANGGTATITSEIHVPAEGPPVITKQLTVNDPKTAVEALALLRNPATFSPVPKPVRKARPKR